MYQKYLEFLRSTITGAILEQKMTTVQFHEDIPDTVINGIVKKCEEEFPAVKISMLPYKQVAVYYIGEKLC